MDRLPSLVPAPPTPGDVHEDDDEALPAGEEGEPVHPPPAGHRLAAEARGPRQGHTNVRGSFNGNKVGNALVANKSVF